MSEKKDGGPAYPSSNEVRVGEFVTGGNSGMTLRDYFSAHSPFGVNQALDVVNGVGVGNTVANVEDIVKTLAELNYAYADAMLAERDK